MKVYLVQWWSYDDSEVMGAFVSKEKAEELAKKARCSIVEVELDESIGLDGPTTGGSG